MTITKMGGGRLAGFPHPAGCIFFYAIIVAHNLLVVNGIFLFKLNNENREAFRMRCHYRKALIIYTSLFLFNLNTGHQRRRPSVGSGVMLRSRSAASCFASAMIWAVRASL